MPLPKRVSGCTPEVTLTLRHHAQPVLRLTAATSHPVDGGSHAIRVMSPAAAGGWIVGPSSTASEPEHAVSPSARAGPCRLRTGTTGRTRARGAAIAGRARADPRRDRPQGPLRGGRPAPGGVRRAARETAVFGVP